MTGQHYVYIEEYNSKNHESVNSEHSEWETHGYESCYVGVTLKIFDWKMKMLPAGPGAVFIWVLAGTLVMKISAQNPAEGNLTDYSDPDDNETIFEGLL